MLIRKKSSGNCRSIPKGGETKNSGYHPFYWDKVAHSQTPGAKDAPCHTHKTTPDAILQDYPKPRQCLPKKRMELFLNLRLGVKEITKLTGLASSEVLKLAQIYHLSGRLQLNSRLQEA